MDDRNEAKLLNYVFSILVGVIIGNLLLISVTLSMLGVI